jgi:SAM-dependent methyltransferase
MNSLSRRSEPHYLRNKQYSNARNLQTRINLHRLYSTNPVNWFEWVFDHIDLPETASILEVGCGPGRLWTANINRLPTDWHILLSDFSYGMLKEARSELAPHTDIQYLACDILAIPLPPETFDLVIANHMLYHVAERPRALSEVVRLLKPGGKFLAATNGLNHMHQIKELLLQIDPDLAAQTDHAFGTSEFTIENGAAQLAQYFSNVYCDLFPDSLEVTHPEPLIAYIISMTADPESARNHKWYKHLNAHLEQEIARKGSFHITKSTGLFLAY